MNRRRLAAGVIAVVMAVLGTTLIVVFVGRAEDRALAGEKVVEVFVADKIVPAGTRGSALESLVRKTKVPTKVRAAGAVSDISRLKDRVAQIDLFPGEQLVLDRFISPDKYHANTSQVSAPTGLVEVTMALDPERALGGRVRPGDTVGMLASFDPFELSAINFAAGTINVNGRPVPIPKDLAQNGGLKTPNTTHLTLHELLVTEVQAAPDSLNTSKAAKETAKDAKSTGLSADAPTGKLYVTLAVTESQAEQIVFTNEFGKVWLANEPHGSRQDDTKVVSRDNVYSEPSVPS